MSRGRVQRQEGAEALSSPPDYSSEEFVALADAIHDAAAETNGCKHPKFTPWQCRLMARDLWDSGVRTATPVEGEQPEHWGHQRHAGPVPVEGDRERLAAILRDLDMVPDKTALDDHTPNDEWARQTTLALADLLFRAGVSLTGSGLRDFLALRPHGTVGPDNVPWFIHCGISHAEGAECVVCAALSGESEEPKETYPDHADMSVDER